MFVFLVFSVNISCISSLELPVGKVVLMLVLYQEKYGLFIHLFTEQKNLLFNCFVLIAFCCFFAAFRADRMAKHVAWPLFNNASPNAEIFGSLFPMEIACYTQVLRIVRVIWK